MRTSPQFIAIGTCAALLVGACSGVADDVRADASSRGVVAGSATTSEPPGTDPSNTEASSTDPSTGEQGPATTSPATTTPGTQAPIATLAVNDPNHSVQLLADGPSGVYSKIDVDFGDVRSVVSDLEYIFVPDDDPNADPSNDFWVVASVKFQGLDNAVQAVEPEQFRLVDPNGAGPVARYFSNQFAETSGNISLQGRESRSTNLIFRTDTRIADLTGWEIWLDRNNEVPAVFPLADGAAVVEPYPVELEAGTTGETTGDSYSAACVPTFGVEVTGIKVTLQTSYESSGSVSAFRAGRNERYVELDVTLTDANDRDMADSCTSSVPRLEETDLRLRVDGRAITPFRGSDVDVGVGSSQQARLLYVIESSVTDLALLGDTDANVLVEWSVDLPVMPGE